ncbi:trihelix transcription factor GT-1 [Cryptomeria japonica]|uniref:trihelix transcription factor GT-1 n=1 Tax=Cryptomeria japonica TaxID=3369 RepID=UPI0025AD12EF|nr:trihelix transcription factor GT-1 [Cryptomeria japonica]
MEVVTGGVTSLPLALPLHQQHQQYQQQHQQQQQHHQQHQQLQQHQQQLVLTESSGDDHELRAPKKRAETWIGDEIKTLLIHRKELDSLFNASKSNKHLWEQISAKMRERGYDRSPTMCKDKWRNLLKDYRKLCHQHKPGTPKSGFYKDIEDIIGDRTKNNNNIVYSSSPIKYESSALQIVPKDFERPALTLDQRLDNDSQATSLLSHESPLSPWNWRDTSANGLPQWNAGMERNVTSGRVIVVKWGDVTRRIGIDGSAEAIKDSIKSVFGLRSKRAFWLEDEDGVVRSFDRDMPLRSYNLQVDPGLTVKICYYDGSGRLPAVTEEKILYCEEDFREFLAKRGWLALREIGGYKDIDSMEELHPNGMYQQGGFKDLGL